MCPKSKPPVACKVDPCKRLKCREDETCIARTCGSCSASCQRNPPVKAPPEPPTTTTCPNGAQPVNCLVDPCISTLCLANTVCQVDYCSGACTAVCKPLPADSGLSISSAEGPPRAIVSAPMQRCSDGSQPVECLVDPCKTANCTSKQICEADNCGGCNARCSNKPGVPDDSRIETAQATPGSCSDGTSPAQCLLDPCVTANCTDEQECQANYCGGCNAVCVARIPEAPGNVTAEPSPTGSCSDGSEPVQCLVSPCHGQAANCTAEQECQADYCGGCNARCIARVPEAGSVEPAVNITSAPLGKNDSSAGDTAKPAPPADTHKPQECAGRLVKCLVDPCASARCMGGLVCEPSACGCTAVCKKP